jgi:hypothetical protein
MPYKTIKQAEKTFRIAIYVRAAQFDKETIRQAEILLLQARSLAISDPIKSKALAMNAQKIALEAIAKTETEKTRLKGVLGSEFASLIREYYRDKVALNDIKKRISDPMYLAISERMKIAEICIRKTKEGLDKEQFNSFPELYTRTKQRLDDVSHVLTPVMERLQPSGSPKIPHRK